MKLSVVSFQQNRTIELEAVYRAFDILHGGRYHK
jgi:23S rRNA pseudoU1915 N3-methylase RlmH